MADKEITEFGRQQTLTDAIVPIVNAPTGAQTNEYAYISDINVNHGITASETAAGVTPTSYKYAPGDVRRYGAVGDGTTDSTTAITNAISAASQAVSAGQGDIVTFPTGEFLINARITLPNRVWLRGANGRGTVIKPHSTFTDDYMFHAVNGTSSMFGSGLEDFYIDARGYNMTAVVYSQAWQDTCGMKRCVIQFNGTTPTGIRFTDGYGGSWICRLEDIEIFADSTAASDVGILVEQISSVGAFVLDMLGCTINGTATNVLSKGVRMVNDSLRAASYHSEYVADCVALEGVGHSIVLGNTGSSNATTSLVDIDSAFTGSLNMMGCFRNSATNFIKDNRTGGYGTITGYDYPLLTIGVDSQAVYAPNTASAWCVFNGTGSDTFVDGNVTVGTDRVTVTSHPFTDGDVTTLTTSGTLPAGLALATTYYIEVVDANTIEFYSDVARATIVDITAAAGGGTHTITTSSIQPINGFNVASITKTGTGDYRVTLTRPMASLNAACFGSCNIETDSTHVSANLVGTTTFDVKVFVAGSPTDSNEVKALVFGT